MDFKKLFSQNPLVLAPMAGVTDYPCRLLALKHGAGLVVSEMVSSRALQHNNSRTMGMLHVADDEHPISVQIFGSSPEAMATAAVYAVQEGADVIDINMGCPTPKIIKSGDGSALMQNPDLAFTIMKSVVDAVTIPVTVKIRSGWNENTKNAVEMAILAEKAGCAAVCIHARTREQFYAGKADWSYIKDVHESVGIPVIGNGDVDSPEAALRMLEETGVESVMIGRAAMGNPWIFSRARALLAGINIPFPTPSERISTAIFHLQLALTYKPEKVVINEMRKHVAWYVKGMHDAAKLKVAACNCLTAEQLLDLLEAYHGTLK